MQVPVTFRGEQVDVVVTAFHYEPDVNFSEVEWHFADPRYDGVELTEQEEDEIAHYLWDEYYEGE